MKKREKILVIAASATVGIFAVNQLICSKSKSPKPIATKRTAEPAPAAEIVDHPGEGESRASQKGIRTSKSKTKFATWRRDPFSEAFRLAKFDPTKDDSAAFVLKGVIWKGNKAHALIGDEIYKVGDKHGDLRVIAIERDRVVCKKRGKLITLLLDEQ